MPSTSLISFDTLVKGVNSPNNFIRSEAHLIDGTEHPGILSQSTHPLFKLPKGAAVCSIKIISLIDAASSGASSGVQFAVYYDGGTDSVFNSSPLSTASGLLAGKVSCYPGTDLKGFNAESEPTIRMAVGTAALTALKLLVIVEYIPVTEFMTAG